MAQSHKRPRSPPAGSGGQAAPDAAPDTDDDAASRSSGSSKRRRDAYAQRGDHPAVHTPADGGGAHAAPAAPPKGTCDIGDWAELKALFAHAVREFDRASPRFFFPTTLFR